jgi:hypothetical protein
MRWAGRLEKKLVRSTYDLDVRSLVRRVTKKLVRLTGKVLRGFR